MSSLSGDLSRRALEVLRQLEEYRADVPYSIYDGSMEEGLMEAYEVFRAIEESLFRAQPVRKLYVGVSAEMELLSRLAMALRMRMHALNTVRVSGISYFNRKLDMAIYRAKSELGIDPNLRLYSMKDW